MSKTIDQKVVEMRFDNRDFEKNVSTTMSSVDKLKKSLNFTGAAKGLEDVGSAAKKVDMHGLGSAVETVSAKFSALQVMGVTALANITNSAVNAGKRIVSALTIEPVKTGFQEYETQINAIQTILANTQSKGSTLEDVNAALDELNKYADQTIYNFTEMTKNIGTFTAAGVDLDKSVSSIKGIANLAAVSGSTSQQASTAMYQLSQALAAGRVSLMDWNSVVNAGMGGEVFQTALKRTATQMGYNVDALIEKYGSFRESLTEGQWLTAEVLTETLTQLSGAYTEADLIAQGYSKDQAQAIVELANTAVSAATDVKTFTQLWDTLKESAQSGWTQSWEIIIGDFEEAKELFSGIYEFFSGIIGRAADFRNAILEGALGGNPFSDLGNKISELTGVTEKVTAVTKDYGDIVNKVINGDLGNGQARFDALTKAGYDYAHAQNLLNEKLGDSTRHATDYKEAQEGVSAAQKITVDELVKMSDAQLKNLGFTQQEVEAFRELEKQSQKTGIPINDLVKDLDQLNGRTLLINSFKNAGQALVKVLTAIRDAWRLAFYGTTNEEDIIAQKTESLYNMISAFHKFTTTLTVSDEAADKIRRTFQGLFAIVDILTTIVGGGFKLAFKGIQVILGAFNMDILDLTASIGDAIVGFRDWLFEGNALAQGVQKLATGLKNAISVVRDWINQFMALPAVQNSIAKFNETVGSISSSVRDYFSGGLERIREFIDSLKSMDSITLDDIGTVLKNFKDNVIDYFFDVDGMFEKIKDAFTSFRNNVKKNFTEAGETVSGLTSTIVNFVKTVTDKLGGFVTIGGLLVAALGVGVFKFANRLFDIIDTLSSPIGAFSDVMESLSGTLKSYSTKIKSEALRNVSISIGILAASIFALTQLDQGKMWSAVAALGVLAGGLIGVSAALGALQKFGSSIKGSFSFTSLAGSILILVVALKMMEGLDEDTLVRNIGILGSLAVGLGLVASLISKATPKLSSGSLMLISLALSIKVLVSALEDIAKLDLDGVIGGIPLVVGAIGGLILMSKAASGLSAGSAIGIIAISLALKMLIGSFESIASLDTNQVYNNIDAFIAIFGMFAVLMVSSHLAGANATKAGLGILAMSAALLLIVPALKGIASIDPVELELASETIYKMLLVFGAVTALSKFSGENATKAGAMALMMSGAILILSGAMVVLAQLDPAGLDQALDAIVTLELVFGALIALTKLADGAKAPLITLTVVVGLLATAVGVLSLIEPERLATASASLSAVMAMFSLMVASTAIAKKANSTLLLMTTVVAALGGILYMLAGLPTESTLVVAESLSLLLLSLSASMVIISNAKSVAPTAYATLGIMVLVVAGLATIIGTLAYFDVGPTLEIAASLSLLLTALSASCLILAAVGKVGAGAALQGALALDGVIVVVGGLMVAIGALAEYFPAMEQFLDKGIVLLEKIGYGLGSFFGNIVGGFMSGVTAGLPDIGTNLSTFMDNIQPFLEGANKVDEKTLTGVKSLAEMILILTGVDLLNGIASFFTGGSSLTKFAEQLVPFGEAMVDFSETLAPNGTSIINTEAIDAAANAGLMLSQMAANIPKEGGFLQKLLGNQNLNSFSEQLTAFGKAIVGFSNTVAPDGVSKINGEAVEAAANAGMALSNLANNIPRQGGWLQDFLGSQDLGVFGEQLTAFGTAVVTFSETIAPDGTSKIHSEAVTAAANAGMAMSELANNLPRQGGWLQSFLGEQDLGKFGTQIVSFGAAMVGFSETIAPGGKSKIHSEAITAAVNAGSALSGLANSLPKQREGFFANLFGSQDMGKFGEQLNAFGSHFASYSSYVENVKPTVVTTTTNAAKSLVALAEAIPESGGLFSSQVSLDEFGEQLSSFGSYFSEFYESIKGVQVAYLQSVVNRMWDLINMAKGMEGVNSSGMSSFSKDLKKLGEAGIDDFLNAFNGATEKVRSAANTLLTTFVNAAQSHKADFSKTFETLINDVLSFMQKKYNDFKMAGSEIITKFLDGVKSKEAVAKASLGTLIENLVPIIRGEYDAFYRAGGHVMTGVQKGIESKSSALQTAAKNVARKIVTSMQSELKIQSPSKVMQDEVGRWIVPGIAEGIEEDDTAEEAAQKKAQNITNAFQEEFDQLDIADQTAELKAQLDGTFDDAAEYERQAKRVSLALGKYENILEVYGETAIDTQKAYNEYLQEEINLRELASEKAQAAFENSQNWIESNKEAGNLSLIDELAAWKRVQSRYLEGTEQRIKANEEVLRLEEEIKSATEDYYEELTTLQEEANQKRIEIDQNYADERVAIQEEADQKLADLDQEYADKTKEINDQLIADIEATQKEYDDAVKSRADSLYNAYGLFDEVTEQEAVTGEQLIANLEGQLEAFENWTENINGLSAKGVDTELIDELREMGPSSAAQIQALNEMTDEELDKYVDLWREKRELAEEQATFELEDLRVETKNQIAQLREDARIELNEYRQTWASQVQAINDETDQKLKELKENWLKEIDDLDAETDSKMKSLKTEWMTTVTGLKTETENAFAGMVMNVINTLGEQSKWSELGANMIEGILQGMNGNVSSLASAAKKAANVALTTMNLVLGIHSPSREGMKIGRYFNEGIAVGLIDYSDAVVNSVDTVSQKALNAMKQSIAMISSAVDENMDAQPTIRPILDLSDLRANAGKIDSVFSRNRALSISSSMAQKGEVEGDLEGASTSRTGNSFIFTQNNYSPKALSRVDIYRQTKNQFSALERMVES